MADSKVGHLFFEYSDNLNRVDLRYAHGTWMRDFFAKWIAEFPDPYPQRYRKNVPYGWVKKNGVLLMTLSSGEVAFPNIIQPSPDSIPKSIKADIEGFAEGDEDR